MLGAAGFLAHIFNQFLKWDVSVDVVAELHADGLQVVDDALVREVLRKELFREKEGDADHVSCVFEMFLRGF